MNETIEQRQCGSSGLKLPALGVGVWSFGGGNYWGAQSQADAEAVVQAALDCGCRYFDTAEMYNDGASERALGQALKGRRAEALIGSKISPSNTTPATLREHCEASLRRLGTDYLDLYMVHWPINAQSIRFFTRDENLINHPPATPAAFETLMQLRAEGKIRHIGVSNFGVRQLAEARATGAEIAVNQLPYSLLCRAIEFEILPCCRRHGIGIIGYIPLMQGLLTGKFRSADEMPPARTRTRHFSGTRPGARHGGPGFENETFETLERLREVAARLNLPLNRLALAWAAANPGIACVLAGARNRAQLQDNAAGVAGRLAPDVIEELNAISRPLMEMLGPSPDLYEKAENNRVW